MELCEGTLQSQTPLQNSEGENIRLFQILFHILTALQLTHGMDLFHLDIKPANILVKDGLYKLGDFGALGTAADDDDDVKCDQRYMAQEILNPGRDFEKVRIIEGSAAVAMFCLNIHTHRTRLHSNAVYLRILFVCIFILLATIYNHSATYLPWDQPCTKSVLVMASPCLVMVTSGSKSVGESYHSLLMCRKVSAPLSGR